MRTPNAACVVCAKPLYRRPGELARVRHVACMAHRAQAQKLSGITEAQQVGLSKGRAKGTNHRTGYQHKAESRRKASESHKAWCAANPDRVVARSEKIGSPDSRVERGMTMKSQKTDFRVEKERACARK